MSERPNETDRPEGEEVDAEAVRAVANTIFAELRANGEPFGAHTRPDENP